MDGPRSGRGVAPSLVGAKANVAAVFARAGRLAAGGDDAVVVRAGSAALAIRVTTGEITLGDAVAQLRLAGLLATAEDGKSAGR